MNKCIFLDRDGVLNHEIGSYVYHAGNFKIIAGVPEAIAKLHSLGYLLIIMTNQGGVSKGLYQEQDVWNCFSWLQEACSNRFTDMYFAPTHPNYSSSLAFKPGRLMFEKALAKYNIDPQKSWMVGDRETDLIPAKYLNMQTVWLACRGQKSPLADVVSENLCSWVSGLRT